MGDMIFWVALAVYLLGWVLDIRPALRRRMLAEVQVPCDRPDCRDREQWIIHPQHCEPVFRHRGAVRERDGGDAAAAVLVAGLWPLHLVGLALGLVLYGAGRGAGALILGGRLTVPELERRLREQQAEIGRLTKEIGS